MKWSLRETVFLFLLIFLLLAPARPEWWNVWDRQSVIETSAPGWWDEGPAPRELVTERGPVPQGPYADEGEWRLAQATGRFCEARTRVIMAERQPGLVFMQPRRILMVQDHAWSFPRPRQLGDPLTMPIVGVRCR
jgi:hypothetical protein